MTLDDDSKPLALDDLSALHALLAEWLTNASAFTFEGPRARQALALIQESSICLNSALINLGLKDG